MPRAFGFLAALTVAVLTGCSSGQVIDELPSNVGLPAGVPARPATPYQYPAVHDMPPPRTAQPMSAEQQLQLEEELTRLRARQESAEARDKRRSGQARNKKPANPAKKKPDSAENSASTGAKPSP